MIGNDLVDLQLAIKESNWQRKGYLNKICTTEEQQLILTSINPLVTFWTLWSMKESVYKIVNRMTGIRNYFPTSYNCTFLQEDKQKPDALQNAIQQNTQSGTPNKLPIKQVNFSGKLIFEQRSFFTHTEIKGQRLHTIAASQPTDFDLIHTLYLNYLTDDLISAANHSDSANSNYPGPLNDTYLNTAADYPDRFNQIAAPYQLSKNKNGIPEITHVTAGTKHPASVSHHGRYLAVIYSDSLLLTD